MKNLLFLLDLSGNQTSKGQKFNEQLSYKRAQSVILNKILPENGIKINNETIIQSIVDTEK